MIGLECYETTAIVPSPPERDRECGLHAPQCLKITHLFTDTVPPVGRGGQGGCSLMSGIPALQLRNSEFDCISSHPMRHPSRLQSSPGLFVWSQPIRVVSSLPSDKKALSSREDVSTPWTWLSLSLLCEDRYRRTDHLPRPRSQSLPWT